MSGYNWERQAGRILNDVVRGGIREGQRESQHQRRMEQQERRHEQQMERGGFRHQQQMETRQMTRDMRGGRPGGYQDPRNDPNYGNQPGGRDYNGDTRRLRVDGDRANPGDPREYRQPGGQRPEGGIPRNIPVERGVVVPSGTGRQDGSSQSGLQYDPRYGSRAEFDARNAALQQGMNAGAEITGGSASRAMKSGAQVIGDSGVQTGAQSYAVAEQTKIEARPLPDIKGNFKTAAYDSRADQPTLQNPVFKSDAAPYTAKGGQNNPLKTADLSGASQLPLKPGDMIKTAMELGGSGTGEKLKNAMKIGEDKSSHLTYEVQKGDTLTKIVSDYYGLDEKKNAKGFKEAMNTVMEKNGMDAKSANLINPGQEIKLPDSPSSKPGTPDVAGQFMEQNAPAAAPSISAPIARPERLVI